MSLRLDWCSYEAAHYAVMRWHYSHAMPSGKLTRVGVWEDDKFIGCIIFGRGANKDLLSPYNLKVNEGCELVRVALDKHKAPVTKIVSIAIKMLKKFSPGLKLIVSYADSRQNHLGIIYQAGNWIYTGRVKTTPDYFYKGRWVHQRTINQVLTAEQYNKLQKRDGGFRLRYLYVLDDTIRADISSLAKEYPKHASIV